MSSIMVVSKGFRKIIHILFTLDCTSNLIAWHAMHSSVLKLLDCLEEWHRCGPFPIFQIASRRSMLDLLGSLEKVHFFVGDWNDGGYLEADGDSKLLEEKLKVFVKIVAS